MKKSNFNKFLLFIPIALVIIYFGAGIFYDPKDIIYVKPLIVPSFIIYACANNYKKLTFNYFLYVVFFYINEFFLLFWLESIVLYRLALVASFFCYLSLINIGYKLLKNKNLYTIPKGYTLFILVLNCLLLALILYILISAIGDLYLNIILIFNAVVAVLLGITAVLFLGRFSNRNAFYYFFGSFALLFNDIFAAIVTYFIDNPVLNTIDRILHYTSFTLIYLFVVTNKKEVEISIKENSTSY